MKTHSELSQKELLEKFFTCALDEEKTYIKQLAAISKTIVIDYELQQFLALKKQFNKNKQDLCKEYMVKDLGMRYYFELEQHNINTMGLLILGIMLAIAAIACISLALTLYLFAPVGIFLYVVGLIVLIATMGCFTESGFRIYDYHKANKVNSQFPDSITSYDFFYDKLYRLFQSNQFETIDCPHLNLYDNGDWELMRVLNDIDKVMNETTVVLPAKITYFDRWHQYRSREVNNYLTDRLKPTASSINEQSKKNDLRNKHRLFYNAGEYSLVADLRIHLFNFLKWIYFPEIIPQHTPLYKEITQDTNNNMEI